MQTLRVAVIGGGFIGKQHMEAIRRIPGTQIVAISEMFEASAKRLAEEQAIPAWYTDYHEMLEKEKPDVVHICTPNNTHFQIAKDVGVARVRLPFEQIDDDSDIFPLVGAGRFFISDNAGIGAGPAAPVLLVDGIVSAENIERSVFVGDNRGVILRRAARIEFRLRADRDNFRLRPRDRTDGAVRSAFAERGAHLRERLAPLELHAGGDSGLYFRAARVDGDSNGVPFLNRGRRDRRSEFEPDVAGRKDLRIERIGEREVAQRGPEFRHGGGSFDSLPVDVERRGDRFVARGQTFGHVDIESADGRVRVGGPFENGRARLDFAGGQFSFRFRGR